MPGEPRKPASGGVERLLALRSFPGLSQVEPAHLAALGELAVERTFAAGEALWRPDRPATGMHLVRRGTVAVLRDGIATRRYHGGDVVGSVAALTGLPAGQNVIAEEETLTLEIERDDFEDMLEESFSLLFAALRGMMRAALHTRLEIPGDAGYSAPVQDLARPRTELGLVERVLFVRRLLTYGRARVEALAELARDMPPVRFGAGEEIWPLGAPAPHSLLVYGGIVAGETARDQRFRFGPDSVIGGVDSIAGEPRWYRAVAETDVIALRSDTTHLIDVLEDHPDMGIDMLRVVARVLTDLYERIDRLAVERA